MIVTINLNHAFNWKIGPEILRKIGSGNIGATNVLRTGKKGLAFITLILDFLKGYLSIYLTINILFSL